MVFGAMICSCSSTSSMSDKHGELETQEEKYFVISYSYNVVIGRPVLVFCWETPELDD